MKKLFAALSLAFLSKWTTAPQRRADELQAGRHIASPDLHNLTRYNPGQILQSIQYHIYP